VILAVDTDALVHWTMAGAPHHRAVRELIEREVRDAGNRLGFAPQVIHEFLHVSTDPRRFENPLTMDAAILMARNLWNSPEVSRILPGPAVLPRTLELLEQHALGRKRILDAALAATLEAASVRRICTLSAQDFEVFSFLEVVHPA
jgi:predicted nucleic acid-binding protein